MFSDIISLQNWVVDNCDKKQASQKISVKQEVKGKRGKEQREMGRWYPEVTR